VTGGEKKDAMAAAAFMEKGADHEIHEEEKRREGLRPKQLKVVVKRRQWG